MNKTKCKRMAVGLVTPIVCLALLFSPGSTLAQTSGLDATPLQQEQPVEELSVWDDQQPQVLATTQADWINRYGNVVLSVTPDTMEEAFDYGDVLELSFLDTTVDVPLCSNYSDVDAGAAGIFVRKGYVILAINGGDFATTYGLASKTDNADGTFSWRIAQGDQLSIAVSLKEKGGYLEEYTLRNLSYTDERDDYPQLTDEQFANFREVTTTGMGEHVLYRSASPVNDAHNRAAYADAALQKAQVTHIVNLADTEEELAAFAGYDQTYYAGVSHIALGMAIDPQQDDYREKLARGLRYLAQNPGVYEVHCLEGKDRTGFVIGVLECLMGATYDEVVGDYMTTYENYYGVGKDEQRYGVIAQNGIVKPLQTAFGVDDLSSVDLAVEAHDYLCGLGLTDDEIAAVVFNLNPKPIYTVSFKTGGHGLAPDAQQVIEGNLATVPAEPAADGLVFAGWYLDDAYTEAFDFATPVTSDLTLYAKWDDATQTPKDDPKGAFGNEEGASGKTPAALAHELAKKNWSEALPQTDDATAPSHAAELALVGVLLAAGGLCVRVGARTRP